MSNTSPAVHVARANNKQVAPHEGRTSAAPVQHAAEAARPKSRRGPAQEQPALPSLSTVSHLNGIKLSDRNHPPSVKQRTHASAQSNVPAAAGLQLGLHQLPSKQKASLPDMDDISSADISEDPSSIDMTAPTAATSTGTRQGHLQSPPARIHGQLQYSQQPPLQQQRPQVSPPESTVPSMADTSAISMSDLSGLPSSMSLQDSQLEIVYSEGDADNHTDTHTGPVEGVSGTQQMMERSTARDSLQDRRSAGGPTHQQVMAPGAGATAPHDMVAAARSIINRDDPLTTDRNSGFPAILQTQEPQIQASEQSYGSVEIEFDASTDSTQKADVFRAGRVREGPDLSSTAVAHNAINQQAVGPLSADLQAALDATQQLFASLALVPCKSGTDSDSSTCRSSHTSCSTAGSSSDGLVHSANEATLRSYLAPERDMRPSTTDQPKASPDLIRNGSCNSSSSRKARSSGSPANLRQHSRSGRLTMWPDADGQHAPELAASSRLSGEGAAVDLLRGLQCVVQMEPSDSLACSKEMDSGIKQVSSSPASAAPVTQGRHQTLVGPQSTQHHLHRQDLPQPGGRSQCSRNDLLLPSCDINDLLRQQVPARASVDGVARGAAGAAGSCTLVTAAGATKQRSVALQVGSINDKGTQVMYDQQRGLLWDGGDMQQVQRHLQRQQQPELWSSQLAQPQPGSRGLLCLPAVDSNECGKASTGLASRRCGMLLSGAGGAEGALLSGRNLQSQVSSWSVLSASLQQLRAATLLDQLERLLQAAQQPPSPAAAAAAPIPQSGVNTSPLATSNAAAAAAPAPAVPAAVAAFAGTTAPSSAAAPDLGLSSLPADKQTKEKLPGAPLADIADIDVLGWSTIPCPAPVAAGSQGVIQQQQQQQQQQHLASKGMFAHNKGRNMYHTTQQAAAPQLEGVQVLEQQHRQSLSESGGPQQTGWCTLPGPDAGAKAEAPIAEAETGPSTQQHQQQLPPLRRQQQQPEQRRHSDEQITDDGDAGWVNLPGQASPQLAVIPAKQVMEEQQQQQQQCQAHLAAPAQCNTSPLASDASEWFMMPLQGTIVASHSTAQPSTGAHAGDNSTAADAAGAATTPAVGTAPTDMWLQLPGLLVAPRAAHTDAEPAECTAETFDGVLQQQQGVGSPSIIDSWPVLPARPAVTAVAAVAGDATPEHLAAAVAATDVRGAKVTKSGSGPAPSEPTNCNRDCPVVGTAGVPSCHSIAGNIRCCGGDAPRGEQQPLQVTGPLASAGHTGAADSVVMTGDDAGHATMQCNSMPSAEASSNAPCSAMQLEYGAHSSSSRSGNTMELYLRYLTTCEAQGTPPPGLTATTAKVLKQDLLQAAALSAQQHFMTAAADVGFTVQKNVPGKVAGVEWGYEDVINQSCVDDFYSSGLDQIRRRIAAAVPGLSAAWANTSRACNGRGTANSVAYGADLGRHGMGSCQQLDDRHHHRYTTLEDTLAMIRQQRARKGGLVA